MSVSHDTAVMISHGNLLCAYIQAAMMAQDRVSVAPVSFFVFCRCSVIEGSLSPPSLRHPQLPTDYR
jgi:hypothetical protein